MPSMGLSIGLSSGATCKRKFRWLMEVPEVAGDDIRLLPPLKTARPNLGFSEIKIEHLNETIYYPGKPDWRPINLTLYDTVVNRKHPVFAWINQMYDPQKGKWETVTFGNFLKTVILKLFDGCGNQIEQWTYEEAWPSQVNFSELNMADSDVVVCEITLRYARAYVEQGDGGVGGSGDSKLSTAFGGPFSPDSIIGGGPGPPGGQTTIGTPRSSQSGDFGFAGGFGGLGSTATNRRGRVGGTIQPTQGVPPPPEFQPNRR